MEYLLHLLLSSQFFLQTAAHFSDAYNSESENPYEWPDWMRWIPDRIPLHTLSLPGTHDTMTYNAFTWEIFTNTQNLWLFAQLASGVRVLDIRFRHYQDDLAIHHGPIYLGTNFGYVMETVARFLAHYRSEAVLIRIKEDFYPESNHRSVEETFEALTSRYKSIIWEPKVKFPKMGEVRGKIIFLDQFSRQGRFYGVTKYGIHWGKYTSVQDQYELGVIWDLHWKWSQVKSHLQLTHKEASDETWHINFLSANKAGLVAPYFVASGHLVKANGGDRLHTGVICLEWDDGPYPDFPKKNCFLGICSVYFEGTNILTQKWIVEKKPKKAGIIFADFIGDGLIHKIIWVNEPIFRWNEIRKANKEEIISKLPKPEPVPDIPENLGKIPKKMYEDVKKKLKKGQYVVTGEDAQKYVGHVQAVVHTEEEEDKEEDTEDEMVQEVPRQRISDIYRKWTGLKPYRKRI